MEPTDPDHSHDEASANSRRPMNAFLLFCKRHRAIVKDKYPNLENRNITKILGEWWQSLEDSEKANFNNLATEIKEHVKREQPNFRWRRPPNPCATSSHFTKSSSQKSVQESTSSEGKPSRISAKPVETSRILSQDDENGSSNASSKSSSPEPSLAHGSSNSASSCAPKPFKKRYLAAEKARMVNTMPEPVSPEAEHACKALLQLAGVRESSPAENYSRSGSSHSGTSSPPSRESELANNNSNRSSAAEGCKTQGFSEIRHAVWGQVARTLLKQEEEKGNHEHDDAPLNLSSQCTIQGQTIIEHIIENILDKPRSDGDNGSVNDHSYLNNNSGGANGENGTSDALNDETAEQIKERIYQGLKKDMMSGGTKGYKDRSALWKLLPHDSLTTNTHKTNTSTNTFSTPKVETKIKSQGSTSPVQSEKRKLDEDDDQTRKTLVAASEKIKREEEKIEEDDGSKLDIKNLLAQSPAPLSPRSKTTSASTASLTNAVIASVLQQQQPIELFLQHRKPPPVSVTLVTTTESGSSSVTKPLNLSTSPPQTPSVSLTPIKDTRVVSSSVASVTITATTVSPNNKRKLDEDEEEIRRSARRCKGKRYQEFKDEGRFGMNKKVSNVRGSRSNHRTGDSGGSADSSTEEQFPASVQLTRIPVESGNGNESGTNGPATVSANLSRNTQHQNPATFDVSAKLNAIPALSLDVYQQKILKAKSSSSSSSSGSSQSRDAKQQHKQCANEYRLNHDYEDYDVDLGKRKNKNKGGLGSANVRKKCRTEMSDVTVSS